MKKLTFLLLWIQLIISAVLYAQNITVVVPPNTTLKITPEIIKNVVQQNFEQLKLGNNNIRIFYTKDPEAFIVAKISRFTYSVSFLLIKSDGNSVTVQDSKFIPHTADFELYFQQGNLQKTSSTYDFLFDTPCNDIPTAVNAINTVSGYATNQNYSVDTKIGSAATINNIVNSINGNDLIAMGNIGHGNSDGILLYDGFLDYTWFGAQDLSNKVFFFNSCEVFNDPLKSAMLNSAHARTYAGGQYNLPIGSSEYVFQDFFDYTINDGTRMDYALDQGMINHNLQQYYGIEGDLGIMTSITTNGTLIRSETWSGNIIITGDVIVPSGITLTIKSNTILNINGFTITSSGGSIVIQSGAAINGALLKTGSTVNAIYPSIESALSAASSGKTVEVLGSQNISNNITINSGITLSVKPNVTLTFGSSKRIYIIGSLAANGATFQGNGTAGSWYALYFYANSAGSFQYCTIKDAQAGIYCNTVTNLTVSNSTISNNSLYGLQLLYSTADISNCTIQNNGTGINSVSSRPTIAGCTIQNNTNYGINASSINQYYPHLFWYDNTFTGNGFAVVLNNASPYLHNNVISNNNHGISITSSYTNFAYPDSNWRGYNAITCNAATPNFRVQNYSSVYAGYGPPNGQDAGGYNSIFGSELPDMEAYDHSTIYACNNYWGSPYPAINADGTSTILAWYPLQSDPNNSNCPLNKRSLDLTKSSEISSKINLSEKYLEAINSGYNRDYLTAKSLLKSIIENKYDEVNSPLALLAYNDFNNKDIDINGTDTSFYSEDVLMNVYNRTKEDPLRPFAVRLLAREAALNGKTDKMISYNTEIIENYPNSTNEVSALYDLVNYYYDVEKDFDTANKYLKRMEEAYPKNDLTLFAKVNLGLSSFDLEKNERITANEKNPDEYILEDNYPNPFNPSTKINYSLKTEGKVSIKIYNTLGEEVITLVDEIKPAGNYEVEFNASELPSGIYIYRMQVGEYVSSKKMLLIK